MRQSALGRAQKPATSPSPRTLHAEIIKEQNVWKYTLYSISAYCNNETARLREVGCNKEEERNSLDLLMNNMKSSLLCLSFESLNQDRRSGEGHWRHIEREGVIWVSPDITKNWEMMFNTGHCFLRLFREPSWGSPQFQYRGTFYSMVFVNDWCVCMPGWVLIFTFIYHWRRMKTIEIIFLSYLARTKEDLSSALNNQLFILIIFWKLCIALCYSNFFLSS